MLEDLEILIRKYNNFYVENDFNMSPTVWNQCDSYINESFNMNFRGENAYVWQERLGDNRDTYQEYYKIVKSIDEDNLLSRTYEDGSYGCKSYDYDNIKISRDLLDSVIEIYFLKSFFKNLEELVLLEIGGGYGRLCKRYLDCFPESKYYITDAIPQSTYYSNVYLNDKDCIIKLYDIDETMKKIKIDIAVNIHSFPECNIKDIEWWIRLMDANKVRYIFYVPNNPASHPMYIPTNNGESILSIFNKYDYTVKYYRDIYKELDIKYSYSVPFFILENEKLNK
jgi:hypothetical protein